MWKKLVKSGTSAHRIELLIALGVPIVGLVVCAVAWLFQR